MSDPPTGQDLPLRRTVIGRREVALRGPFRLRLASACRTACRALDEHCDPTQPRTRAGAMSGTLTPYASNVRGVGRGNTHGPLSGRPSAPLPAPEEPRSRAVHRRDRRAWEHPLRHRPYPSDQPVSFTDPYRPPGLPGRSAGPHPRTRPARPGIPTTLGNYPPPDLPRSHILTYDPFTPHVTLVTSPSRLLLHSPGSGMAPAPRPLGGCVSLVCLRASRPRAVLPLMAASTAWLQSAGAVGAGAVGLAPVGRARSAGRGRPGADGLASVGLVPVGRGGRFGFGRPGRSVWFPSRL
jgi:hypothetical protein